MSTFSPKRLHNKASHTPPAPTSAWASPPASPAARADASHWSTYCAARDSSKSTPHLREGRTLPPDAQEMARTPSPTSTSCMPTRRLHRRTQAPPPTPVTTPPSDHRQQRVRTDHVDIYGCLSLRVGRQGSDHEPDRDHSGRRRTHPHHDLLWYRLSSRPLAFRGWLPCRR
jgi:hypothetical protein